MLRLRSFVRRRWPEVLVLSAVACVTPPPGAARPAQVGTRAAATELSRAGADADEIPGFELPVRRSQAPQGAALPALPSALRAPPDVTLELETTRVGAGGSVTRHQDVARSADHLHIRLAEEGLEWLFVRNPLDERRVSATLVDHRQRAIIEYAESELRTGGIARGWADVVCLGVGTDTLQQLEPTGRSLNRFGFDFSELSVAAGESSPLQEVWWSAEAALPLRVSRAGAGQRAEVRALRPGVDRERFAEPRQRFSAYLLMDVADYREKHHDAPPPDRAATDAARLDETAGDR
jgi:hypothetical protein